MNNLLRFTFYIFISLNFLSCSKKQIQEGKIIYAIDYPQIDKEKQSITYMLLPKKQSFTFDQNHIKVKVKKAMFDLTIITGTKKDYFYTDLTFNGTQFVDFNGTETEEVLNYVPKYAIKYTDEKDTLLGFTIKKIIASHEDIGEVEAWYTDEINLENANWFTPFRDLQGVLMKYTVNQFGVKMNFTASSIEALDTDSTIFNRTLTGDEIGLESFQKEMNDLFKGIAK